MKIQNIPYVYLAGDIMSAGSNLARQKEYDSFKAAGLDANVYSPVMNKSINDKSAMTEDENNHLAEKITEQDIDRMWKADTVVMCPEQHAVGSLCEMGCLYGWKYIAAKFNDGIESILNSIDRDRSYEEVRREFEHRVSELAFSIMYKLNFKDVYAHYFDIRTNHLNEKDWRRSFSINQLLYGMILDVTRDHTLHNSFEEVLDILKGDYDRRNQCEEAIEEDFEGVRHAAESEI